VAWNDNKIFSQWRDSMWLEGMCMANSNRKDELISDSGILEDEHTKQARIFVFLCDIVAIVLIALGLIAFIKGTF
jgi:hypothetical protein